MSEKTEIELLARIERLEKSNRRLTLLSLFWLLLPLLAVVGWQNAPQVQELVRARQIEVVDERGVPMVILTTGRDGEGGAITLRDSTGERRAWWTSSPEGSSLAMTKERAANAEGGHTAGLSVDKDSSQISLIGPEGAMFSATVRGSDPRLDLWGDKGETVFGAPWQRRQ
jgi:hypothetical protein